jgi:hypothetical protein
MAGRLCWSCGIRSHMTLIDPSVRVKSVPGVRRQIVQGAFTCDECNMMSIGYADRDTARQTGEAIAFLKFQYQSRELSWLPLAGERPGVP